MASNKKSEIPFDTFKNESARQRWELFHRAIAHAKASNNDSLLEAETCDADVETAGPVLSIVG